MTITTRRGTINDGEFAALCNLFHTISCEEQELTPAEIGDILYYRANPVVCDNSRTAARAVMAYLGLRFAGGQPWHEPGSGCRFADENGNCDFHDIRHANALVDETEDAMRAGDGALSYREDA
jgi:hypothetical protein